MAGGMRSLILAGSLLVGGTTSGVGAVLADTTPASDPWAPLVSGAVGTTSAAAVLGWRLKKRDEEISELRAEIGRAHDEIRRLNERAILRAEAMEPAFEKAVSTLERVKEGMGATIENVRPADIARVVQDLKDVAGDIARGRGREA